MGSWNNFHWAADLFEQGDEIYRADFLSLLNCCCTGQSTPTHLVFAGSVISVLPILVLFLFAQRYFIAGLTAGSIK